MFRSPKDTFVIALVIFSSKTKYVYIHPWINRKNMSMSQSVNKHTFAYRYIHMCTNIHVFISIHIYMYTCVCIHIHIYIYIHIYTYIYIYTYMCIYIYKWIYIYIYMCVYIYIYTERNLLFQEVLERRVELAFDFAHDLLQQNHLWKIPPQISMSLSVLRLF